MFTPAPGRCPRCAGRGAFSSCCCRRRAVDSGSGPARVIFIRPSATFRSRQMPGTDMSPLAACRRLGACRMRTSMAARARCRRGRYSKPPSMPMARSRRRLQPPPSQPRRSLSAFTEIIFRLRQRQPHRRTRRSPVTAKGIAREIFFRPPRTLAAPRYTFSYCSGAASPEKRSSRRYPPLPP